MICHLKAARLQARRSHPSTGVLPREVCSHAEHAPKDAHSNTRRKEREDKVQQVCPTERHTATSRMNLRNGVLRKLWVKSESQKMPYSTKAPCLAQKQIKLNYVSFRDMNVCDDSVFKTAHGWTTQAGSSARASSDWPCAPWWVHSRRRCCLIWVKYYTVKLKIQLWNNQNKNIIYYMFDIIFNL